MTGTVTSENIYTIIPTSYVIHTVTTLELSNLAIFYDYHDIDGVNYLFTIFRYKKDFMKYIILASPEADASEKKVLFFGVNYDGTLLQTYRIDDVFSAPVSIVRSKISLYWRYNQYDLCFKVPNINSYNSVKEHILNLFTFPQLSYVILGKLMVNFTLVEGYYYPSYFGRINYKSKQVDPLTTFDFCKGTLVSKMNEQLTALWNTQNFAVTNQFPELDDATPENVIIGGVNDYVFNTRNTAKIITKATYSTGLSFQANEIKGTYLTYIPLKTFIQIDSLRQETFLIAFSNTPYSTSGMTLSNDFPMYATFGKSSFQNAKQSIITENIECELVYEKDDTFQEYKDGEVIFCFKYDEVSNKLKVYEEGFLLFLIEEKGEIVLSDLKPYQLGDKVVYNAAKNSAKGGIDYMLNPAD